MVILLCFLIAGICFALVALINKGEQDTAEKRKSGIQDIIKEKNISVDKRYDSNLSFNVLIHDAVNENIWYLEFSKYAPKEKVHIPKVISKINYHDIIQVELKEDDELLVVTSRTSQLGSAIVGGALAGGVGAVIGGLSGKQKQKREVKKIQIHLTLNDLQNPLLKINFEDFVKPVQTSLRSYLIKHEEALNWFKLMEVIIKRTESKQH
ncbi:hypothetical protein [Priestia megaterium]|uniref:hypothetical protein n=1 Tax=Priestia megaterium TaxID=1404 RepID=UPI002E1FBBE5|nr:hypothetical protein [Priestia megaterium]